MAARLRPHGESSAKDVGSNRRIFMTRKFVFISTAMLTALSVLAQNDPTQPPQTYSQQSSINTNQTEARGMTFSNRSGQNFAPEDLASQLQNLRAVVDQT